MLCTVSSGRRYSCTCRKVFWVLCREWSVLSLLDSDTRDVPILRDLQDLGYSGLVEIILGFEVYPVAYAASAKWHRRCAKEPTYAKSLAPDLDGIQLLCLACILLELL